MIDRSKSLVAPHKNRGNMKTKKQNPWELLADVGIKNNEDSFDSILMSLELVSDSGSTGSCLYLGDTWVTNFSDEPKAKARFILAQWHADQHTTIEEVRSYVDRLLERLDGQGLTIAQA